MPLFKRKSDKRVQQPVVQVHSNPPAAKPSSNSPAVGVVGPIQDGTQPMEERIGVEDAPDGPGPMMASTNALQRTLSNEEGRLGDLGAGKLGKRTMLLDQSKLFDALPISHRSRLCKALPDFLQDNGALPYLIQFMDSLALVQLVQCWLVMENFNKASWSHSLTAPMEIEGRSSILENRTNGTVPRIEVTGSSSNDEDIETVTNNNQSKKSVDPPSVKAKTHSRASSDSAAMDIARLAHTNGNNRDGHHKKGHRRNISDWKNVDPKTAVERDAINIYTKYLCRDATTPVGVPENMRLAVIAKICPPEGGDLNPDCFKEAQEYLYNRLEKQYFPEFLRSEFHCKYQVDILTSGKVYLADVLNVESATSYLIEYLDQEGAVHMLHFWLAASNFQQQLLMQQGQYDAQQAQDDAMVLYDKYFSLQAEHPLGFDFQMRCEVESNICREGGPLPNCFNNAMKQTFTTLETVYFPGFLSSQLYYKFLSELINSIKTESDTIPLEPEDPPKGRDTPKTQRNTLLADGVKKLMQSDMSIDPSQLDPDTLWKRNEQENMVSFGKVDSLGQFVPGFEMDPESVQKRAGSKFSFKKLVTKEEDKAKEQMALQIAQMIINDVTVQTKGTCQPTNTKPS